VDVSTQATCLRGACAVMPAVLQHVLQVLSWLMMCFNMALHP
jgi:hypothetical protein